MRTARTITKRDTLLLDRQYDVRSAVAAQLEFPSHVLETHSRRTRVLCYVRTVLEIITIGLPDARDLSNVIEDRGRTNEPTNSSNDGRN